MDYKQTLDYLFSQLPMFQRLGAAAYKANLDNTIALCNILGNPQNNFKSIHIAGTNGKGSVSHFIASILQSAGLKVGLYTSPHLKDFRERMRINGKKIHRGYVTEFVKTNKKPFANIKPSFFEYTFGMAVQYFSEEKVDIAIMEVGMGGRLDSTNVVNSIISVITNIGFDHTQFLGNTLEKIAIEKAGILKPDIPVVIGETQNKIKHIFLKRAKELGSPLFFADQKFEARNIKTTGKIYPKLAMDIFEQDELFMKNLLCEVTGLYQQKNIITTLQIVKVLTDIGLDISEQNIREGFKNVVNKTGLQGRWQILNRKPLTICDTGHNIDGIKEIVTQIKKTSYRKLHFVLGVVNDKNIDAVLKLLPKKAQYYFCKANIPRGLDHDKLKNIAGDYGLQGKSFNSVYEAFSSARSNAHKHDLIFVGGSTFVVAEIL